MSVKETAMQNVWRHHFVQPGALSDERGECGIHTTTGTENSNTFTKMMDPSQPTLKINQNQNMFVSTPGTSSDNLNKHKL
jgi:hypothetical protein